MSDFYQHQHITTLHHLAEPDLEALEGVLARYSKKRPVSLVMPALFSELAQPALPLILKELSKVDYLHEIVISMNRMNAEEFEFSRKFFTDGLPESQRWNILWNDGPRVAALYDDLKENNLTEYVPGKGYNVWMAYGYLIAKGESLIIAAHDSDILSYHREMLQRLCFPTVHPSLAYKYCKSYYGRVSERMYGRVTRLFVGPLLRAMSKVLGGHPLLEYLNDFRYPLSGEFSLGVDMAESIRIPGDWGLEIGMLCEVWRNTTSRRICQVDLGNNFEHKHQHLGFDPNHHPEVAPGAEEEPRATEGLMKMAHDIALSLLHNLVSEGVVIGDAELKAIRLTYERLAKDTVKRYFDDSLINGLEYYRHEEARAVDAYYVAFDEAAERFAARQYKSPLIPNWNRVNAAIPDMGERLIAAVDEDNR